MENKHQKLQKLRSWLNRYAILYDFGPGVERHTEGTDVLLWIPDYKIAIIDEKRVEEDYLKLTSINAKVFVIHEKDRGKDIIEKIWNYIEDISLKQIIKKTWESLDEETKRRYEGIWPMNYGRFKKEFIYALGLAQGNIDNVVRFYVGKPFNKINDGRKN